jgi:hypothetical protein
MVLHLALALTACFLQAADPLEEIDGVFHQAYAAAKAGALARQGPVLVVSGDQLILYRDQDVVATAVIRAPPYHRLKDLAHVPLAIRLVAGGDGPLDPARAARLAALREKVAAAGAHPILAASLAFLDEALARKAVSGLDAYCAAMGGPLDAAAREAAALELEPLAKVVATWRKGPLAADWDRVRVVVIGSHMARDGEVSWQFFARLLDEPREGGRMVYAEEKWDPRDAMGLLASHALDGDLGRAFFGDPGRMHRDVLAPGARIWVDSHPPVP